MNGISWTPEEIETLLRMRKEGASVREVSLALGRSYESCVSKGIALREYGDCPANSSGRKSKRTAEPLVAPRKCLHCRQLHRPAHKHNWICYPCATSEPFGGRARGEASAGQGTPTA